MEKEKVQGTGKAGGMKRHRKAYTAAKAGKVVTVCGKMVLSHKAALNWENTNCVDCNVKEAKRSARAVIEEAKK